MSNPFSAKNIKNLSDECFAFVDKNKRIFPHHLLSGEVDIHHLRSAAFEATRFNREVPENMNPWGIETLEERKAILIHLFPHTEDAGLTNWSEAIVRALESVERLIRIRSSIAKARKDE